MRIAFIGVIVLTAIQLVLSLPLGYLTRDGNPEIKALAAHIPPKQPVVLLDQLPYAPLFYTDSVVREVSDLADAAQLRENHFYLIAAEDKYREAVAQHADQFEYSIIAKSGDVILALAKRMVHEQ